MRYFKHVIVSIFILGALVGVVFLDIIDRLNYENCISEKEAKFHNRSEDIYKVYQAHFGSPEFNFPRKKTEYAKIYRNELIIGRFTGISLSQQSSLEIQKILNNPDNFTWDETTWTLREAEYIIRFFDVEDKEIGKVWLCMKGCGMTESQPFSPNMKFGRLSNEGIKKLSDFINKVYSN